MGLSTWSVSWSGAAPPSERSSKYIALIDRLCELACANRRCGEARRPHVGRARCPGELAVGHGRSFSVRRVIRAFIWSSSYIRAMRTAVVRFAFSLTSTQDQA